MGLVDPQARTVTPLALTEAEAARGALAATCCYLFWGVVPLYWKRLAHVDSCEVIAHRHVWSLAVLLLLLAARGGLDEVWPLLRSPRSTA